MADCSALKCNLRRKRWLSVAALAASVPFTCPLALAAQSRAQSQVQDPGTRQDAATKPLAYDYVTVKPGTHMAGGGMRMSSTPNSFSATNDSLESLIMGAYGLQMDDLISGLPAWAKSATFDIEAKMAADTFAAYQKLPRKQQREQDLQMMQSLLKDRFNLKVHHATRQIPIYALVIAKGGSKLKESTTKQGWGSVRDGQIDYRHADMDSLAEILSGEVDRIVLDETGLTGKYDFTLEWTPDEERGAADARPSIFTAVQEQLGLKLESTTGPIDTVVVDHIDRPSPN